MWKQVRARQEKILLFRVGQYSGGERLCVRMVTPVLRERRDRHGDHRISLVCVCVSVIAGIRRKNIFK
jgi:hypothetical protein